MNKEAYCGYCLDLLDVRQGRGYKGTNQEYFCVRCDCYIWGITLTKEERDERVRSEGV